MNDEKNSGADKIIGSTVELGVGTCGHFCEACARRDDEIDRLRKAIRRALDDEESGSGWGPDVTVCGYLREALTPNAMLSGAATEVEPKRDV